MVTTISFAVRAIKTRLLLFEGLEGLVFSKCYGFLHTLPHSARGLLIAPLRDWA